MRWYLALIIRLWFLLISQDSATTTDMCYSIAQKSSPGSKNLSLLVQDITAMQTTCFCEFPTNPVIFISSLCLFYQCFSCQSDYKCASSSCFCTHDDLDISPERSCPIFTTQTCPPGTDQKYSCQTSKDFTLYNSKEPLTGCSNEQTIEGFVLVFQQKVSDQGGNNRVFGKLMCHTNSIVPEMSSTTVSPANWSSTTASAKTNVIIGVVVGVGGAVLITAIAIVIVVLRRRRAESNNLHAKNTSQSNAPVSSETAYASYTTPVSAAYDNATSGTTLNYQPIVYDNEEVGESNDAYTEVKEISNHDDYDNHEMGRSDAYSMCKETDKDYDIVNENQSENIGTETTVIDNEFYG